MSVGVTVGAAMFRRFLGYGLPLMALGLLLAFLPTNILPVCHVEEGAVPMRCHWTGRVLTGYGAALVALGALMFLCRTASMRAGVAASALVVAVSAALVPTHFVGMCQSPMMPCNTGTYPGSLVLLALAAVVSLATLFQLRYVMKRDL